MNFPSPELSQKLCELLERRLAVIADQDLRERDPAAQLEQLKEVSEKLTTLHQENKGSLPPRLNHFLERASFSKALAWLKGEETEGH